MLLKLKASRTRDDEGAAIVAVMGMVAVAAIVTLVITAATMTAVSHTTATRAGVQSQAAADAGVDYAVSRIHVGQCGSNFTRTFGQIYSQAEVADFGVEASDPFFDVDVFWKPVLTGTWVAGCPSGLLSSLLNYQVRIESTGYATSTATGDIAALDSHTVEAIYGWTLAPVAPDNSIRASGAAIYSYSTPNQNINGLDLNSVGQYIAGIQYKTGDFYCTNTSIDGSVTVSSGKATVDSACSIQGDLMTSSSVSMPSNGRISGNVTAAGVTSGTSFVQSNSSGWVGRNVYARGPVSMHGTVVGNVVSGPTTGQSVFNQTARIGQSLTTAGTINANWCGSCNSAQSKTSMKNSGVVAGEINYSISGIAAPQLPTVPGWVDFAYNPADWVTPSGATFSVITLNPLLITPNDCGWDWDSTGMAKLRQAVNSTTPTIIDARNCSSLNMYYGLNPKLKSDLVIVTNNKFTGGNNTWSSADGQPKRLWFINPDGVKDGVPGTLVPCTTERYNFNSGFTIGAGVTATVYTPCRIENSSTTWVGQMYANQVVMHGNITFNYTPNGLPGVNLDTGEYSSGGGIIPLPNLGSLGELDYYRDVPGPTGG